MWKSLKRLLTVAALMAPLIACASYTDETREIRSLYRGDAYQKALAKLEESELAKSSKNRLLYALERAMVFDRMGELKKSRTLLLEADRIADALYTVSATQVAASFVVNESSTDYSGEDFEKVAIHTLLALSFIEDGEWNSALVEARKINTKLIEINKGYDSKKNKYGEDAFARYLAGLIYDLKGEEDSAIIDYWKAYELYTGQYRPFYDGTVPDGLVRRLYELLVEKGRTSRISQLKKEQPSITAKMDSEMRQMPEGAWLAVVHELGDIQTKSTEEFLLPIGKQVVRFSFPVYRTSRRAYGRTGIRLGEAGFTSADNVQNMDAIARQTLEDRRLRLVAKQAGRLLVKGQITEQAYNHLGPLGGIAANIITAATETADTRSWTLLPSAFHITHVRVKPGAYTVQVESNGKLQSIKSVKLRRGETQLVRAKD